MTEWKQVGASKVNQPRHCQKTETKNKAPSIMNSVSLRVKKNIAIEHIWKKKKENLLNIFRSLSKLFFTE